MNTSLRNNEHLHAQYQRRFNQFSGLSLTNNPNHTRFSDLTPLRHTLTNSHQYAAALTPLPQNVPYILGKLVFFPNILPFIVFFPSQEEILSTLEVHIKQSQMQNISTTVDSLKHFEFHDIPSTDSEIYTNLLTGLLTRCNVADLLLLTPNQDQKVCIPYSHRILSLSISFLSLKDWTPHNPSTHTFASNYTHLFLHTFISVNQRVPNYTESLTFSNCFPAILALLCSDNYLIVQLVSHSFIPSSFILLLSFLYFHSFLSFSDSFLVFHYYCTHITDFTSWPSVFS